MFVCTEIDKHGCGSITCGIDISMDAKGGPAMLGFDKLSYAERGGRIVAA